MTQRKLSFEERKPLGSMLEIPKRVQSVYSLTQHVWAGEGEVERLKSKENNRVRLETLDEFFIDPVRNYLNRVYERVADNEGQGFWFQAEFGVGKSHLLATTAILAVGGPDAWERLKQRENEEGKAGPGARLDNLWRKKVEERKLFPIIFSLEGCGGTHEKKLEDFILEEAQATFALRERKPLAVYPEEHLARLFLKEHQKVFQNDLKQFLADNRLMRGLPRYDYADLIKALQSTVSQRDAGRVLMAFYRERNLTPRIPTEKGERLARAVDDLLRAGYDGIFVVIDEMSEYLRRSQFPGDDEDCLLTLSSTIAKAQGQPIWTLVAAQAAHSNPQKIIGPDRLFQELLEHKAERFRDIVVQRTRTIKDAAAVQSYYQGYKNLIPWVKNTPKEEFEASFPFPPDTIQIIRAISTKLTGTRSTISFLHAALRKAAQTGSKDLVPLWRVFDDLMSYNETPSPSATGAISIRSRFRQEVAALEAAQATLKRITDGQLARPQNRSRSERILNTLFLHHLAGVAGLTVEQVLDAVCDLKPGEDELEAQLGHYGTLLEEMTAKLRNQIRFREGRYEFIPKQTGDYDDLVFAAAGRLKTDPELLSRYVDRTLALTDPELQSPFAGFVPEEDGRRIQKKVVWHGQERSGRVTAMDLRERSTLPDVETHEEDDDFLIVLARRALTEKKIDALLRGEPLADPRLVIWAPASPNENEKATLAGALAHLLVADESKETAFEKEARKEFRREAPRAYTVLLDLYGRGTAKTSRTSLDTVLVGGLESAIGRMAGAAMDTCYQSRLVDFGSRKFDSQTAIKLINGLVKRGCAVSEGDQLWSAVENFAPPLGLVRPPALDRLDPSGSPFYRAIRERVEEKGRVGIEVRTVHNWFTGYDRKDGKESPGLTRRMVDVYLLCLAQQGIIRISDKKTGIWVDRSSIAGIDFKPETLRNLGRIELPRALEDWPVFSPYLELLTGRQPNSLGPRYDKVTAEEALRDLYERRWVADGEIDLTAQQLRDLFAQLGRPGENPFDELLLYWLTFAEEPRPAQYDDVEVFDALRRAILRATSVETPQALTSEHLTVFQEKHRRLTDLKISFPQTSVTLLRAARLAKAQVPEDPGTLEIRRAQREMSDELEKAADLVLNPDSVAARLLPRFQRLQELYIPAYVDYLMELNSIQRDVSRAQHEGLQAGEIQVLEDFAAEVNEAARILEITREAFARVPAPLRPGGEDRDRAEKDVRQDGYIRDSLNEPLSFQRIASECATRRDALGRLEETPRNALLYFAEFLRSPGVASRLKAAPEPSKSLQELMCSADRAEAAEVLHTLPSLERRALAKELARLLEGKRAKTVRLREFHPRTDVVWTQTDLNTVVAEFSEYLKGAWEEGRYLKIE